jgi:hypothetical protein
LRLAELGLTVGDVDLGGFDAESDRRLPDYFVSTTYSADLTRGRGTLFVGRKGSGKSALFDQLPRLLRGDDPKLVVVRLTPDDFAWNTLKEYVEEGLAQEQAHSHAWKLTIATEVAAAIAAESLHWSHGASASLGKLGKFVQDNFGELGASPHTKAFPLLRSVDSLDVTALGLVNVGIKRSLTPRSATPPIVEKLVELLKMPLNEIGVVVALDRLDRWWDGSHDSRSSLIGLLDASKALNDRFGLEARKGLRVITFLRSDIYDSLKFDDKDKFRQTERQMVWTVSELKEMLQRRLPSRVTVDDLFEPGRIDSASSAFTYMASRTFLRPREILEFVDASMQAAGRHSTVIKRKHIREAERRYGNWKVEDLKQEYRRSCPPFGQVLECLRNGPSVFDSMDELVARLRAESPDYVEHYTGYGLVQMLFEASAIGARAPGSGTVDFKSRDPFAVLPPTGRYYVHSALHRGLHTLPARRLTQPTSQTKGSG